MASKRDDYITAVKQKLKRNSDFLGQKPWITGDSITFVDFMLFEILDNLRLFEPGLLDDYVNLKEFMDRFEALPVIKDYMKSDEYLQQPVFFPRAQWY